MAIEVEYHGLTGTVGNPGDENDLILLRHAPSTGPVGGLNPEDDYDIALDPNDGPAQRLGVDFGVTHLDASGYTTAIALDLENSDVKDVLNDLSHGVTGMLNIRIVYNYETGM